MSKSNRPRLPRGSKIGTFEALNRLFFTFSTASGIE